MRPHYVVAFYLIDRQYGGPEEGGWWYNTGGLVSIFRVTPNEESAYVMARRANHLFQLLQRGKREIGSVLYNHDRFAAEVYEDIPPTYYPAVRPHYE